MTRLSVFGRPALANGIVRPLGKRLRRLLLLLLLLRLPPGRPPVRHLAHRHHIFFPSRAVDPLSVAVFEVRAVTSS